MGGENYIPRSDSEFDTWQNNFVTYVMANATALGITTAEVNELSSARAAWNTSYAIHITQQNASRGAAEIKDETKDAHESIIRQLTKKIQARKETSDLQRESLGITVRDTTKTPLSEQIVLTEPPPIIEAKCTGPKTVRIDFYPTQAPGESEALPQGIDGVAIWFAEGGIPATEGSWRFLALDTNSPYIHNVGNTGTMTLAYKAQWFDKRKRMGPFCDPVVIGVTG
ncbi:MAG: hypothetical protein HY769_07465 [Candidatus Stahlbacteria bacterium]|nr:hypothetical protein [Candidatus Stahlbacteria bacterium]